MPTTRPHRFIGIGRKAKVYGVSRTYLYMVLTGQRRNDRILRMWTVDEAYRAERQRRLEQEAAAEAKAAKAAAAASAAPAEAAPGRPLILPNATRLNAAVAALPNAPYQKVVTRRYRRKLDRLYYKFVAEAEAGRLV